MILDFVLSWSEKYLGWKRSLAGPYTDEHETQPASSTGNCLTIAHYESRLSGEKFDADQERPGLETLIRQRVQAEVRTQLAAALRAQRQAEESTASGFHTRSGRPDLQWRGDGISAFEHSFYFSPETNVTILKHSSRDL